MDAFLLTSNPIEIAPLEKALADPAAGALVTFAGRVRNHQDGRSVLALEYEAHLPLAERAGRQILAELHAVHPACRILARHRLGHLAIGEIALWVGVISPHRAEAFAACEACIIAIKSRVPIWKKESYADQSASWLEQTVLTPPSASP